MKKFFEENLELLLKVFDFTLALYLLDKARQGTFFI